MKRVKELFRTMSILLCIAMLISSAATQSGHPEFDKPTEQVVLVEGSLEKVECVAKGELPLTYTWYDKNDAEIPSEANEELFTRRTEKGNSLIFVDVKQSHAGLYSCSATNKHGTASKAYDLIVNSTSGNITTNETAEITSVKVINITENSVEFDVQAIGRPESFYIRYLERVTLTEFYVQIKRGDRAIVTDLIPSGYYEFRFQIEPPSRIKILATVYTAILLPGVPDVIFRNAQNGFVEVEWFRSIDDFSRKTIEEYELSYNIVQQFRGRSWEPNACVITIKIPNHHCSPARYTFAGLSKGSYYEIRLRARTSTGYGRSYVNKVYIQ